MTGQESSNIEGSEEVLELANGCLCCSIKDTGIAAIEKLMRRKGAFDHILLETTGLADPGQKHTHDSNTHAYALFRSYRCDVLAKRGVFYGPWSGYTSRRRCLRRGRRVRSTGRSQSFDPLVLYLTL